MNNFIMGPKVDKLVLKRYELKLKVSNFSFLLLSPFDFSLFPELNNSKARALWNCIYPTGVLDKKIDLLLDLAFV